MDFETWKAEFEPRVYEDTGAWCEEHADDNEANPAQWCDCEYLYTFDIMDGEEWAELKQAILESRAWTWRGDGTIVNGIEPRGDYLITSKPWTEETEVI